MLSGPDNNHLAKPSSEHLESSDSTGGSSKNSQSRHTGDVNGKKTPDSAHAYSPGSVSDTDVSHASHKTRDAENRPAYNHVYTSSSRTCTSNTLLIISLLSVSIVIYWRRN
jgi:hypothetical protein